MKVKEESEKVGLKLNIQKMKIMASHPITSWQMGKQWKEWDFIFWGLQNYYRWWCSHVIKNTCSLEEKLWATYTA